MQTTSPWSIVFDTSRLFHCLFVCSAHSLYCSSKPDLWASWKNQEPSKFCKLAFGETKKNDLFWDLLNVKTLFIRKCMSLWMLFYPVSNSSNTVEPRGDFSNGCLAADDTVANPEKAATRRRSGFTGSHHPAGRTGSAPGDIYSCCVFATYSTCSLTLLCVVA